MADIAEFGIGIDYTPIKTAKQELTELANSFYSAQKSASVFEQAFAKAAAQSARDAKFLSDRIKLNQDLINTNLKISNSYKSAEQAALAFSEVFANQDRQAKQFTSNFNNLITSVHSYKSAMESASSFTEMFANQDRQAKEFTNTLNRLSGVTGELATSGGAGFSALEASLENLRIKYDKAYVAEKLFVTQKTELKSAILNEIGDVTQLQSKLDSLESEYSKIGTTSKNTAEAFIRNNSVLGQSKSMYSGFGFAVQQTGYQVGDFIVQVQSGTNPIVAFGQQATQLVYILPSLATEFGLTSVALGGFSVGIGALTAGLGIGIPLLTAIAGYFMRTGDSAKNGKSGIDTYTEAMKGLTEEIHKNEDAFLKAKYGTDNANIANAKEQVNSLKTQINDLNATIAALDKSGGGQYAIGLSVQAAFQEKKKTDLQSQLDILVQQLRVQEGLNALEEASSLQNKIKLDKIDAQKASAIAYTNALLAQEKAWADYYDKQKEAADKAGEKARYLKDVFHAMAGEASSVSVSMNDWPGKIAAANGPASVLAGYMHQIAVGASMMGRGLPALPGGPRSFGIGGIPVLPGSETPGGVRPQTKPDFSVFEGTGSLGGGKGSNQLLESLMTQQEQIDKWYEESQKSLQTASDKELAILGGREEAKFRLLEEYRQKNFDAQQAQSQLLFNAQSGMYGALGDLLNQFGSKSKGAAIAALAIQKGLSIAQIITSTAAAQMRAMAELGPIAGAAMAAKIGIMGKIQMGLVAATGLMQAGSIASGGVGGGSGSVGTTAGTTTTTQTATPLSVLIQGIKPTDIFTGEQLSNLFDSLYKENRNRGMVFQVAR